MAGIYIHIPFCKQACHYCDFHFSTSLKKKGELLNALVKELQLRSVEFLGQTVETIYFGGGTPSLLTIAELRFLIEAIYKNYTISPNPEITLEANPDDLVHHKIIDLHRSPVNRLSIGIQSFFDEHLKSMNRAHNANEARACLKEATFYFDNITVDLIYGIPDMSIEVWDRNLDIVLDFGINHVSAYALTVEPKTALDNFIRTGNYPPINDELALRHFQQLMERTQKAGFVQYEISNFGRSNYFSKHNTSYWQGKPYLGIGPSAHSFNGTNRSWNVANNITYIQSLEKNLLPLTIETLSKEDRFNEWVMIGLRTIWGVSLGQIQLTFGETFANHLKHSAEKYIKEGLLYLEEDAKSVNLKTTRKGKFLVDGLASDLFMVI